MERPTNFAHHRYVGDKRTLEFYDVDALTDEAIMDELQLAGTFTTFAPDTVIEAKNRGYQQYTGPGAG
jgi:hypothetical protein